MSIEEKFEKAVNVIRNLPKHGSYQPSHELQLRFYAFYKQATEGPNRQTRPNFWEVVKKAKWDAWNKLGNMPKEDAMVNYVEELRKIVETMAYTDNVESFLNSLDDFYENVPPEDLDLLVGPVIQRIRSNPNSPLNGSPLGSRDTSPMRPLSSPTPLHPISGSLETSPASSYSASPPPTETDEEDDDDHFLDATLDPQLSILQSEPDSTNKGAAKKTRQEKSTSKRSVTRNVTPDRSYLLSVGTTGSVTVCEDSVGPSCEGSDPTITDQSSGVGNMQSEPDNASKGAVKKTRQEKTASKRSVTRNVTPDRSYLLSAGREVDSDDSENALGRQTEPINSSHNAKTDMQKKVSFEGIPAHRSQAKTCLLEHIEPSTVSNEAFQRAISNLTKEMELLQRRTAMLESLHLEETTAGGPGARVPLPVVPSWWSLSLPTTTVVILWPVFIVLVSRWLSSRRRQ